MDLKISSRSRSRSDALLFKLHVEPEAADFVGEHVEAGRRAGFQVVLTFDHSLVNLGTTLDVVALHGEEFLKDVGGAIGF